MQENETSSSSNSENEDSTAEDQIEDDVVRDVTIKLGPVVALQKKCGLDEDAVNFGRPSWFVDLKQEGSGSDVNAPPSGVVSGVERGSESLAATGVVGAGVGGVAGVVEVAKSAVEDGGGGGGEEEGGGGGGGGKGWMEGVKGSAMATASGILQLIQSRPATDTQQGGVVKTDAFTRHSINFDMKFQTTTGPQTGQSLLDGKSALLNSRYGLGIFACDIGSPI